MNSIPIAIQFSYLLEDEQEVRHLSQKELRWLLEGLSIQQPKAIQPSAKGTF
ncbi:hypothetical protein M3182_20925 [Mesobacillus maritimus]|nr:hypothetical protein [Mesobacillus maritimus]MCM3588168.1 hypothetical protein [Mesobacillus maritimus]MCM3668897.1 hypothetical protein [Mesobacillus maritimus]